MASLDFLLYMPFLGAQGDGRTAALPKEVWGVVPIVGLAVEKLARQKHQGF